MIKNKNTNNKISAETNKTINTVDEVVNEVVDKAIDKVINEDANDTINHYDSNGNIIYTKTSAGDMIWRKYDAIGKCTHIKSSNGYQCKYEYDELGRLKLMTEKNTDGSTTQRAFNNKGECISSITI